MMEKNYDAPILNEEVILNHIIQKDEQQIIFIDLDDDAWNLERYRSNDDNNNFNYDDIDKEILRFKYEDSIGESDTIVFHDCDDNLDATQQEEGKYSIIELDNNDNNKYIYYDTVYLLLLISRMLSFVPPWESLVYHVSLF